MILRRIAFDFIAIFCIALVVSIVVSFLYSLIVHGSGAVNWGFSFQIAIVFGIVFSWLNVRARKDGADRESQKP